MFSNEWDELYSNGRHQSVWPWSDVVSLVHRHGGFSGDKGRYSVLELGCGVGANIPFFRSINVQYFAIEGSETAVEDLHSRYPDLQENILRGDFTASDFMRGDFDLVVDRAALTHNNTDSIRRGLKFALSELKTGGVYIGVDWFSVNHYCFSCEAAVEDRFTRSGYAEGPFDSVGKVHFSDEEHLRDLFQGFEIILLEEKVVREFEPVYGRQSASWNIVARKV